MKHYKGEYDFVGKTKENYETTIEKYGKTIGNPKENIFFGVYYF